MIPKKKIRAFKRFQIWNPGSAIPGSVFKFMRCKPKDISSRKCIFNQGEDSPQ